VKGKIIVVERRVDAKSVRRAENREREPREERSVPLKRVAQAAKESRTPITARGILPAALGSRLGVISSTSASNMIHGTFLQLLLARVLTLELFVEGEDCFLARGVDVACSASAG